MPRILLLADDCNPLWPSLPVVGYKYALALGRIADVTIATHPRNRPNIEADRPDDQRFAYIDNERVARPMFRLQKLLRGGTDVAWTTGLAMSYLPYLEFERQAFKHFRPQIEAGEFDIIHRITPMSPPLPSWIAGRGGVPFVLGPLNGNLPWPREFLAEQARERERLSRIRNIYKRLPYSKSTFERADLIFASFAHTVGDIAPRHHGKIVSMPEVGFDPEIFHACGRTPAFAGPGPRRFLYAGRLVPYKLPEVAVRGFCGSKARDDCFLHIVGSGPEEPRLKTIASELGGSERVIFEGQKTQAEVANMMRRCDALIFPSIRELGAGIVIEAMACGMTCIVAAYGAPGSLAASGRGHLIAINDLDTMCADTTRIIDGSMDDPAQSTALAAAGQAYAEAGFTWDRKAELTLPYYADLLSGQPIRDRQDYDL